MSFIKVPSKIQKASNTYSWLTPNILYKGLGVDSGLYVYALSSTSYFMSQFFANSIVISGNTFSPVYTDVYGSIYWSHLNTSYVYMNDYEGPIGSQPQPFVYISGFYPGYQPYEIEIESGTYTGDAFYTGYINGGTITFEPRGSLRNSGQPVVANIVADGWVSTTLCGIYTPIGAAQGNKVFGTPQWIDTNNKTYTRSLTADPVYSYGDIVYYNDGHGVSTWIIGTYGSVSGWWEGSEPQLQSSVIFYEKDGSGESTGNTITVSFNQYVLGDNKEYVYLSEVSVWR